VFLLVSFVSPQKNQNENPLRNVDCYFQAKQKIMNPTNNKLME